MIIRRHFEVEETAVTIITDEQYISSIEKSIFDSRSILKKYISECPEFQWSLEPIEINSEEEIIRRMCDAACKAGVGPMAAVAGAVAEQAVETAMKKGAEHCIVENGGDIAMLLSKEVSIGIFAPGIDGLGFRVEPREGIFGICTSSATVGPSISFGASDAAIVISKNVCLADACATKLGNLITSDDDSTIKSALDQITNIGGVEGAFAALNSKVAMKGTLPQFIKVDFDDTKITGIKFQ